MTTDLSNVSPVFTGQTSEPSKESGLSSISSVFTDTSPSIDDTTTDAQPATTGEIIRDISKTAGAGLVAKGTAPESSKIREARATMVTAPKAVTSAHAKNVLSLMDQDKLHQANIAIAKDTFNNALSKALDLGAIPDNPKEVEMLFGKNFTYPGMLSPGAERHTDIMSEIRQGNKVQRGVEGVKEFSGQGGPLTGFTRKSRLIVPNKLESAPLLTKDQLLAQQALKEAHDAHQMALENHAAHQAELDNAHKELKKATLNQLEKESAFTGYQPSQAMNLLKTIAREGGTALSGLSLYDAYNKLKEGDYTGLADLSLGVGGLMTRIPYLQPAGILTMIPGAAYTGGKAALELMDRYKASQEGK
jgi:hypothetical protein